MFHIEISPIYLHVSEIYLWFIIPFTIREIRRKFTNHNQLVMKYIHWVRLYF